MIFPQKERRKSRRAGDWGASLWRTAPDRPWLQKTMAIQLFAVCLAIAALVTRLPGFSIRSIGYDIENQTVAMEEVRAAIPFQSEDLQATKEKRDEAAKATLDTYRVDRERVAKQLQLLDDRIQFLASKRADVEKAVREALRLSTSAQSEEEIVRKALLAFVERIEPELRLDKPADPVALACWLEPVPETLPKRVFTAARNRPQQTVASLQDPPAATYVLANLRDLSQLARDSLEYVLSYGIVPENRLPAGENERFSVIRDVLVGDLKPAEEILCKKLPTVRTAPDLLRARLADLAREAALRGVADRPVDWTRLQQAAFELARTCIAETLSYDAVYTEGAREHARLMVPPVVKEIQAGEVIQRSGDRWTAQSRSDVRAYWAKLRARQAPWSRLIGIASANTVLAVLAVACLARVIAFLTRKSDAAQRHMRVVCVLILGTLFLGRVIQYFDPSGLSAPIAAAGILAAILTNARVAVMASVIVAFLISIQYGYDWRLFVVGASMALAGVFGTFRVRRRGDMTRAALSATIVGILVVLAVTIGMDSLAPGAVLRRVLLVLGGCVACIFIVPGVLSPLERLFGITTDIQLLEFSDLNNELLSRIAIEMPGTYAHSLMLGQFAEAAADAIGANGLLARVAAYYHDVGKLRHPEYFSENQNGPNIHDTLPPRASARAIAAHVAHGAEIAREYHLPQPIINAILEHHGTTLISFFHQKACDRQRHDEIREEDYRYPGPKPQSRESAILMICDAVESGVRSIKNPNEDRVRDFADKIIMNRWSDRQLDQCHLTLRDLDAIKEVLVSRVMTSFHTRIAYPDKGGVRSAANVIPMPGG